ncbi:hypothetical protein OC844_001504 [Tilletia horrida]|nr:hypothetical protein OC844_001504 [Tilletia horrida]
MAEDWHQLLSRQDPELLNSLGLDGLSPRAPSHAPRPERVLPAFAASFLESSQNSRTGHTHGRHKDKDQHAPPHKHRQGSGVQGEGEGGGGDDGEGVRGDGGKDELGDRGKARQGGPDGDDDSGSDADSVHSLPIALPSSRRPTRIRPTHLPTILKFRSKVARLTARLCSTLRISHAKARRILGFAQQGGKASRWFNRYSRWMARTGKSLPDDPSNPTGESSKLTHRNRLVALHWARLKRNRAEKRNTTLAIRKWEREHRANITVQAAQTALSDIHEAEKFHGIILFAAAAHPLSVANRWFLVDPDRKALVDVSAFDAKDSKQLFKNFASQVNVKVKFKDEEEDQIETLISSMSFSIALTGANLDAGIAAVPARGQMPVLAKPLMMFAGVMPRSRASPYRLKDVT